MEEARLMKALRLVQAHPLLGLSLFVYFCLLLLGGLQAFANASFYLQ